MSFRALPSPNHTGIPCKSAPSLISHEVSRQPHCSVCSELHLLQKLRQGLGIFCLCTPTWPGLIFYKIHPAGSAGGADPHQEAFVSSRLSFEWVPQLPAFAAPSGVLVQLCSVLGNLILWRNSDFILLRFPHPALLWGSEMEV